MCLHVEDALWSFLVSKTIMFLSVFFFDKLHVYYISVQTFITKYIVHL